MKKNPIYFLGLDLKPKGGTASGLNFGMGKFWGGTWDPISEGRQRELLGYARGLLEPSGIELIHVLYDKPEESKLLALRRIKFNEIPGIGQG